MKEKLTAYELATLAARFGLDLSPADAVARALQVYEAANAILRPAEVLLESEEAALEATVANLEEWLPQGDRISIAEGLAYLQERSAGKRFKSEPYLLRALQKRNAAFKIREGIWITSRKLLDEFARDRRKADSNRPRASKNKLSGNSL